MFFAQKMRHFTVLNTYVFTYVDMHIYTKCLILALLGYL